MGTTGCTGAAATFEPRAGEAATVLVVVVTTGPLLTRASVTGADVGAGPATGDVAGVCEERTVVEVVVVVLDAGPARDGPRAACVRGPGCSPSGCGRPAATAATTARSDSDTARTTHQWGRLRAGREPSYSRLVATPPTA